MRYSVACVQFAPQKAAISENLKRIAELTQEVAQKGADVVLFPESATSGYFLEGGVLQCALSIEELTTSLTNQLNGFHQPVDIVVGFYEKHNEMLFNSAAYLEWDTKNLKSLHVYRKFFLPTYGVFDEERFVSSGSELGVFETRFGTASMLICEDVWHSILPTLCALKGAEILYIPSASPARGFTNAVPSNVDRYARMIKSIAEEHGMYVANAMLLGFEGGKGFAGGGSICDPEGVELSRSPILEEHAIVAEVDRNRVTQARANLPLLNDLKNRWATVVRLASEI